MRVLGWIPLGLGFLAFTSTLRALAPSLTFQDSGELIASVHLLGVAHPPGSPFWCLMAKGMCLLPAGNVAFRVNLLSSLWSAVAASCVGLMGARMSERVGASPIQRAVATLAAGLTFLWAKDPWLKSGLAEVYVPSCGLLLLTFLLSESPRGLACAWLLFGLNLGVHQSSCLALPWLLWRTAKAGIHRPWAWVFLAGTLAGACHLYLPLRSACDPAMDWGDPEGIQGFLWSTLRIQWGPPKLSVAAIRGLGSALAYLLPWREFSAALGLLLLAGWLGWILRCKGRLPGYASFAFFYGVFMAWTLAGTLGPSGLDFLSPSIGEFFIPWYAALALGWAALPWRLKGRRLLWPYVLALTMPVLLYGRSMALCDKRGHWYAEEMVRKAWADAERDRVALTCSDDITFGMWYASWVEAKRPKAWVVDRRGLLGWRHYASQVAQRRPDLRYRLGTYARPSPVKRGVEIVLEPGVGAGWQIGNDEEAMAFRLRPRAGLFANAEQDLSPMPGPILDRYDEAWERRWGPLLRDFGFFLDPNGPSALFWFAGGPVAYFEERREWSGCVRFLKKMILLRPGCAEFWAEMGMCQWRLGQPEDALRSSQEALRIDPRCSKARELSRMLGNAGA